MTAQPTALRELTTIGVGGVPEQLRVATTREEIVSQALEMWREADEWMVLGGGSNLVVADDIPHLQVLQIATKGVESSLVEGTNRVRLRVEAGENWDDLVAGTVQAGLAGLEPLSGIPGSVGASPVQNIGAYGAEVANLISRIGFLDFLTGETETIEAEALKFGYRDSILKQGRLGVVLWVEFELENLGGLSAPVAFDQLAKALAVDLGAQVPVAKVRDAVLQLRSAKGMVLDPNDPDTAGCGSFFTNPIVTDRHARTLPSEAPRWETVEDDGQTVKLSAAWLIEKAGIPKGFRIPGSKAAVSSKHTLAITNTGGASAGEILELAEFIQARVSNTYGVNLRPEPNIVGF